MATTHLIPKEGGVQAMRLLPRAVLLLSLAALVAGCASPSAPVAEPTPTAEPTFTVVGDNEIPAIVLTDTLHVLAQPDVTTRAPDSYTDLRVPVPSIGDIPGMLVAEASGASVDGRWQHPLPEGITGVVGTATFWVDVRGTVLNNPNPLAEGCFWQFRFITGGAQTGNSHFAPCVKENATVPEGLRQVTFTFDLPNVAVAPGGVLDFDFYTGDAGRAPDATIDLLTGSIVHDSRIEIVGLQLPVDGSALLSTT